MHTSKAHAEVEIKLQLFLASALTEVSGKLPTLAALEKRS